MKYLHKFNENKDGVPDSLIEIKNLCNTNLAYLMDEGFKLDDFIPSIIMLSEKYKLYQHYTNKDICINFLKETDTYFSIEDLLEYNIPNSLILNIKFHAFL